ncbi:MAG: hypothetical protein ABIP17_02425 [Ilumatobacteraceae bacterium]
MNVEVRRSLVALSADALMLQWARQEQAPAGSVIVVDNEIAARTHGGSHWVRPDSLTIAVLARPRTLEPDVAELAWLAGGIGVAAAFDELTNERHVCSWPDRVESSLATGDDQRPEILMTASSLLGPGRIEHVVVVARITGASQLPDDSLVPVTIEHLRLATDLLDEPDRVVSLYRDRFVALGTRMAVALLPSGTIQGRACDVGIDGSLIIESVTGMRERVTVAACRDATRIRD